MRETQTFVSDLICVAVHLVMFVVLAAAPVLQFLHVSLWGAFRKVFSEQNERTPPQVSASLLCVRLPVINEYSASLTDTATTKTPERQTPKKREKSERQGRNKRQHSLQAS